MYTAKHVYEMFLDRITEEVKTLTMTTVLTTVWQALGQEMQSCFDRIQKVTAYITSTTQYCDDVTWLTCRWRQQAILQGTSQSCLQVWIEQLLAPRWTWLWTLTRIRSAQCTSRCRTSSPAANQKTTARINYTAGDVLFLLARVSSLLCL